VRNPTEANEGNEEGAILAECAELGLAARSKTPGSAVAAVCDRRNRARMCTFFGAHRAPLQFLNGLPGTRICLGWILLMQHPSKKAQSEDFCNAPMSGLAEIWGRFTQGGARFTQ